VTKSTEKKKETEKKTSLHHCKNNTILATLRILKFQLYNNIIKLFLFGFTTVFLSLLLLDTYIVIISDLTSDFYVLFFFKAVAPKSRS